MEALRIKNNADTADQKYDKKNSGKCTPVGSQRVKKSHSDMQHLGVWGAEGPSTLFKFLKRVHGPKGCIVKFAMCEKSTL